MDLVGVGGASGEESETYDTWSTDTCDIASYETFTGGAYYRMMCDFVFGKGMCCGGTIDPVNHLYTDMCGFYDCFANDWTRFHDLPKKLIYASSTPVREKGRDIGWLVSGGLGKFVPRSRMAEVYHKRGSL